MFFVVGKRDVWLVGVKFSDLRDFSDYVLQPCMRNCKSHNASTKISNSKPFFPRL